MEVRSALLNAYCALRNGVQITLRHPQARISRHGAPPDRHGSPSRQNWGARHWLILTQLTTQSYRTPSISAHDERMNAISPKGSPLAERFSCPSGMTEHYPRVEGPSESPGDGWTVRVAAAMFPVAAAERMALMTALGDGWEVQDGRRVERADAVLLLPCSGQTVAAVRRRFPDARIVLVDSPLESATHPAGPIHRVLEAGADLYLPHIADIAA